MKSGQQRPGSTSEINYSERPKFIEAGYQQKLLNLFYNHLATGNLEMASALFGLIYSQHRDSFYRIIKELFSPQKIRYL